MSGPLPDFEEYRTVRVRVGNNEDGANNRRSTNQDVAPPVDPTAETPRDPESQKKPEGEEEAPAWTKFDLIGPLQWSGYPAGGLIADIRRRAPYYISDWTDPFKSKENLNQSLSTILFCFFACFAPALAFGTIFDSVSGGEFGIVEMLLSTAISGIVYAFFSGQPITIMGATGPELAYTIVFYQICVQFNLEFLPARFWQGMWTALFTVLLAITDSCCLMHYVTRFTEEIFSALISTIEIITAFINIVNIFGSGVSVSASLWSLILSLLTYGLAVFFRDFKASDWLNAPIRKNLSNYGVILSILIATFASAGFVPWAQITDLEYLNVPTEFAPTYVIPETGMRRPWAVNPMGITRPFPVWAIFFTAIPAIGLTILGYLDQNLTEVIINGKDRKLQKPPGYHLDLFTCGALIYPPCSILGLPFTHAATVRSLAHLLSLNKTEVVQLESGRNEVKVVGVLEQRFTHLIVHILIAVSVLATPILRLVPRPVIIGIFLYLGVSSIKGNQLFDRIWLLFVWDHSRWPDLPYVNDVPKKEMLKFTGLQLICLVVLIVLSRVSEVSVVFPFVIGALIPFRKWPVPKWFNEEALKVLDS